MEKVKVTMNDGSFKCLTWKKQKDGLFAISNDHYDKNGYYKAHLSTNKNDVPFEQIERCVASARKLFSRVEIY